MFEQRASSFEQQASVFERASSFKHNSATRVRTNAFEHRLSLVGAQHAAPQLARTNNISIKFSYLHPHYLLDKNIL